MSYEINPNRLEVLRDLVTRLDNQRPGTSGYIVERDELVDILLSLTPHLGANVILNPLHPGEHPDWVKVELKTTFSLSRQELGL